MEKIEAFKISLQKRPSVYAPGEKLTGRVLIHLKESLKIENVNVNIIGDAKVHW